VWSTVLMAFVHGHARDTGWVVAHVRAPVDAEDGQLELVSDPSPDDEPGPADAESVPVSSDRNSEITRS
jgi:hypothetical protein